MKTEFDATQTPHPNSNEYRLERAGQKWLLLFAGHRASFSHELGALYVAGLLWEPRQEPVHAVALALQTRGRPEGGAPQWDAQELAMGVGEAEAVRALWRRQRELERVLEDELVSEPVKAEALAELEELTERLRKSPWLSHRGAERCTRAVAAAIKTFHARLARAVDARGNPDLVLRAFARHLLEYLLIPSGRGGGEFGPWLASVPPGCFTYEPPKGVRWEGSPKEGGMRNAECGTDQMRNAECGVRNAPMRNGECGVRNEASEGVRTRLRRTSARQDAFKCGMRNGECIKRTALCMVVGLGVLVAGCAGPRPLKGGQAVTRRSASGASQETFLQGENPAQASRQEHSSTRVRTYILPAGSSIVGGGEESRNPNSEDRRKAEARSPRTSACGGSQLSTLNPQLLLSAPMPVTERQETRTRAELGASQKDSARELGAKLSSLRGIVWVGVGLFVFGLTSLVYPPLKVVIASVTTSAALMVGGIALMVLPTMVVGNELLILGMVGVTVGAWFLAHRHGHLKGEVSTLKAKP